jgi:hypothetical protein
VSRTAQGVVDYVYAAQTYILGQNSPPSTQQTLPLFSSVVVTGPLRLGFWANPFDAVAGGDWWGTAYTLPDVALNHPQRWTWTNGSSDPNIMTFNAPVTSTSPFDQEFYMLRGLLVTPAGSPNGTQATTAAVDDTVLLQARVYNYSHLDMDDPSLAQKAASVKVRFYGQLFRSDAGEYPVGGSFLIGEPPTPRRGTCPIGPWPCRSSARRTLRPHRTATSTYASGWQYGWKMRRATSWEKWQGTG